MTLRLITDERRINRKPEVQPPPAFLLNHKAVPRRLYTRCPVIDTLLLCAGSIFKYSADLEP